MGLFDDDFYSPKISRRRERAWLEEEQAPRTGWRKLSRARSRRQISTVKVAVISSVISALMAVILYSWLTGTGTPSQQIASASGGYVNDPYERIVQAAAKVSPTVVSIVNKQKDLMEQESKPQEASLGSGVIFKQEDGKAYVMTNDHVVQGADLLEVVMANGQRKHAELVGKDKVTDIAVLKMDGAGISAVAELGDSRKLRRGETVIAIGNPLGLGDSLTAGIISYTNRVIPVSLNADGVYDWEQSVIQTDAAINEGNSGGALVDLSGRVIGINTMKISTTGVEGLGFAIPSHEVTSIVEQLMENGKVVRPYLGVYTVDLNNPYAPITKEQRADMKLPDSVTQGVIVLEATGPAETAGLKLNDVIVKFDSEDIGSTLELRKYLYENKKIGDSMNVVFYRDGEMMTVAITLTDKPES
ncbi:trypsin-like peptidase domain-containing protein [Paenibacillus sp. ACRRX]|uniref:S1C family serine protease n=1 Tax=Paenibacillus sp. ACRRX TaxID=2918206 RepID=UPI001EF5718C|nr:trypsin-like peptidase domain-containing protein [Paenibacillus sp. ACRRX]MCG7408354.1 trypsin-like peptidase domain-containing protein [Paenibacillus sp. ACRRX]